MKSQIYKIVLLNFLLVFSSCSYLIYTDSDGYDRSVIIDGINAFFGYKKEIFTEVNTYTGWWVYGEGQHIFKDEATLEEWNLKFLNENMEELVALYLSVCEMEYFPMECNMTGHLQNDTLEVADFEITYIQGCGE